MSELSLCVCLCKKRVENFPSFQTTTRGGEREKVKAAADEHTQKPPTISKEPEESYDADRKAGRNGFLFFFGPQLSSPSFAYMIINLLLFLTSCQQQHHHHRHCTHSLSHRRRRRSSRSKEIFSVFSSTFTSRRVCIYNLSFLGAHWSAREIFSFTSYDYKVYDVRKLPNHIALDSTGVRTQEIL